MALRIPSRLLPNKVTVKKFLGSGSDGDVWAAPVTKRRCQVRMKVTIITNVLGEQKTSTAQVYCEPETDIPAGSLVTVWPGTKSAHEGRVIAHELVLDPVVPGTLTLYLE